MAFLLALLTALASAPHAQAGPHNCFKVHEKQRCFMELGSSLLGMGCPLVSGTYDCQASRALSAASSAKLTDADLEGGKNPGALLCKRLAGSLEIGTDWAGNQEAICVFGDNSMVTATSLWLKREESVAAPAPVPKKRKK